MRRYVNIISLLIVLLIPGNAVTQEEATDFLVFRGPYLGQTLPGKIPEVFAPEILSKSKPEWAFDSVFSPCGNEFYFTLFDQEEKTDKIMIMKKENNIWTKPEATWFNGKYTNHNLCISPDGYRMFFKSWRPLPGNNTREEHSYIWYVQRTKKEWSEPWPVEYDNTFLPAGHPSITNNGTLYFRYRNEDNIGNADIHMSMFVNGSYSIPVNLGRTINTVYTEGDVSVAADESFLVVGCWERPDNSGESDLYISFRSDDGSWTALINMGEPINTTQNENNPMISPDGKYLFFMRVNVEKEMPECSTYWVDARIIEDLKPAHIK